MGNVGGVICPSVGKIIVFYEGLPYVTNDTKVLEKWMTVYYQTKDDEPLQFPTLHISWLFVPEWIKMHDVNEY